MECGDDWKRIGQVKFWAFLNSHLNWLLILQAIQIQVKVISTTIVKKVQLLFTNWRWNQPPFMSLLCVSEFMTSTVRGLHGKIDCILIMGSSFKADLSTQNRGLSCIIQDFTNSPELLWRWNAYWPLYDCNWVTHKHKGISCDLLCWSTFLSRFVMWSYPEPWGSPDGPFFLERDLNAWHGCTLGHQSISSLGFMDYDLYQFGRVSKCFPIQKSWKGVTVFPLWV